MVCRKLLASRSRGRPAQQLAWLACVIGRWLKPLLYGETTWHIARYVNHCLLAHSPSQY